MSRQYTAQVTAGQWLEALELTLGDPIESREGGLIGIVNVDVFLYGAPQQRDIYHPANSRHLLFAPSPDQVIAGLVGVSKGSRIASIGLVECTRSAKLIRRPLPNPTTRRLAWLGSIPPAHISVLSTTLRTLDNTMLDKLHAEMILFGSDDEHTYPQPSAEHLLSFAISADLSTAQLTFQGTAHRQPNTVKKYGRGFGPLKTLNIDGSGGEHIIGLAMPPSPGPEQGTQWYGPKCFRVYINRNRQMTFGIHLPHETLEPIEAPAGQGVVGIFITPVYMQYWPLGVLITPSKRAEASLKTIVDSDGRAWDPAPPPFDWHVAGPAIGQDDMPFATRSNSADLANRVVADTVVFLDLQKPVTHIRGLYISPYWHQLEDLGGFEVVFDNQTSCCVGTRVSIDDVPIHEEVSYEDVRAGLKTVPASGPRASGATPHYENEKDWIAQNQGPGGEWLVSQHGSRIASVIVWGDAYLHGLQFIIESGAASPKWGKAGAAPSATFLSVWTQQPRQSGLSLDSRLRHIVDRGGEEKEVKYCSSVKFVVRTSSQHSKSKYPGPVMVQVLASSSRMR